MQKERTRRASAEATHLVCNNLLEHVLLIGIFFKFCYHYYRIRTTFYSLFIILYFKDSLHIPRVKFLNGQLYYDLYVYRLT